MDTIETRADALRHQVEAHQGSLGAAAGPDAVLHIRVHDQVIADPFTYRDWVRRQATQSVAIGPATFHGIAKCPDPALPDWIQAHYPHLTPGITFVRESPAGQVEPNFIHTDRDMGDWTGILYLNPQPAKGDGTTFWRHRITGARASTADSSQLLPEWQEWRKPLVWQPWTTVAARFNRLVLFPAALFHSRALPDNYGHGESARLIQIIFGTGTL